MLNCYFRVNSKQRSVPLKIVTCIFLENVLNIRADIPTKLQKYEFLKNIQIINRMLFD